MSYNNYMIQISHEFPNYFYQEGYAEDFTDYDYCLVHRYLSNPSYREYMLNAKKNGRCLIIDNSLFEIGSAFSSDEYIRVIKELNPTYYVLPDVFDNYEENIKSQIDFYNKCGKEVDSIPIAPLHSKDNVEDLIRAFKIFDETFPKEVMIAIPFGSGSFKESYIKSSMIEYEPIRMALNRQFFLKEYADLFNNSGRKFHLLGCKSLAEFESFGLTFDKRFIKSIDTSLPVAYALDKNIENNEWCFNDRINVDNLKINPFWYKPKYLIDKHFDDVDFGDNILYIISIMENNIGWFQDDVRRWYEE